MAGKLFVGGLWYETTDETLRSYFEAWGAVLDAVVIRDPVSRRSRGFGFVTYADPSSAHLALAQPNHMIDNRRVSRHNTLRFDALGFALIWLYSCRSMQSRQCPQ